MFLTGAALNLPFPQQTSIERESLFEKLKLVIQHKVTLVIAPPGYGKTTLITQFARKIVYPVAWHSVEKREQDFPNFFEHCLTALEDVIPEISTLNPHANASESELALLVAEYLRKNFRHDFIYILDDVHHLMDSPKVRTWLRTFIANMPRTCHVILIGRALPPLPVTEMIAHREILAFGQEQLSFTFDEVSELATRVGLNLTGMQIQKIFSRLGGWPAGILLALQPLPIELETSLLNDRNGPEGLFDDLAEIMFDAQPLPLQEFLLSSSTFWKFTPTLCQNVLHLTESLERLTEALNRNLFITQIPGGVVYHSLFRDFLQRKLQTQKPSHFIQLHIDAGTWFEAENRLDEAFDHFIAAHAWENAAAIAERAVQAYLARGKAETVLYWRTQLEGHDVKVSRLVYMCAMLYRDRYEYDLAFLNLSKAEAGFQEQGNEIGLIQTALLKATIDNQRGNYQQAITQAESVIHHVSIPPNLRGYALAIIGTAALYLGNLDGAIGYLETALPLWRETGDVFAIAQLLMTVQVTYLRLGRFGDAIQCVEEVMAIRRALGETVGVVMGLNNLGYHYHLLGHYHQAQNILQEGFQVAQRAPENRAESHLLWTMGDLQRDRGAFDEAVLLYHRALQFIGDSEPFLRVSVLISLATLRRWEGKIDEAYQLVHEGEILTEKHSLIWEKELVKIALSAISIEESKFQFDKAYLETVVARWKKHQAPQLVPALALCAYNALLSSDASKADAYLKLAIETVSHSANLQPLISEIFHIPMLKEYLLHNHSRYGILVKALSLLEDAQIETQSETSSGKSGSLPTYSLRIRVLGQENIERDGKLIVPSQWQAASARELFFYLLFKGATSREHIGLAFWPDSSTQQVRQKFHTTLHRVREAIGSNVIVFENDTYMVNTNIDIWCDVIEFESVFQQAQLSSPLVAHTETLWHRAVQLYQGEFLTAFDKDWVIGYRELLAQMHLDALLALANCVRTRGDTREAISILKRALDIDSYREDIHRALLKCYKMLGEPNLIIRHVNELTHLLNSELGTAPSQETILLSQTLLS